MNRPTPSRPAPSPPAPGAPDRTTLAQRYGDDQPDPASLADWTDVVRTQVEHRSVRAFVDTDVDPSVIRSMIVAAQSAPTSSNLQAWSVIEIRDPVRRETAARLCGDQDFIRRAPVFLLWVVDLARAQALADREERPLDGAGFLDVTMVGIIDAALAAQNAALAAESYGLGTVYVGGARNHPEELAAFAGLPPRTFVAFGLAVGHPDPERPAPIKPRLPLAVVHHRERYSDHDADRLIAGYDATVARFYRDQAMTAAWTDRVLDRLADAGSLKGRDQLAATLRDRLLGLA